MRQGCLPLFLAALLACSPQLTGSAAPLSPAHARLDAALEAAAEASTAIPTWWECGTCALCAFGAHKPPPSARLGAVSSCPLCTGCTHHLVFLDTNTPLPVDGYAPARARFGSTGATVFVATDGNGTESVLKLHGMAGPMVSSAKLKSLKQRYSSRRYLAKELVLVRFLTPLAQECGLGGVSITEWLARVRAVVPESGMLLDEPHAVLAERARGASVETLTLKLRPSDLLASLAAVPHAAVRDAALLDLLFVQGDRHAENVYIDEGGALKLIDTRDAALDDALDSIFFPGCFYFERNRVGNGNIRNASIPAVSHHWPQLTLDYRCHVPGGAIGTNFPPQFRQCITRWAGMPLRDFKAQHFPTTFEDASAVAVHAERLHTQARLLLEHGFEGALARTRRKNSTGLVPFNTGYPLREPCCAVEQVAHNGYACASHAHQTLASHL